MTSPLANIDSQMLATRIPNELWFEIFSYLPLKSLIRAKGVCRLWRVIMPFANIHPIRRHLLELYMTIIYSKSFNFNRHHLYPPEFVPPIRSIEPSPDSSTSPTPRSSLFEDDRQKFITYFENLCEGAIVSDELRLWILEMPVNVGIHRFWASLPSFEVINMTFVPRVSLADDGSFVHSVPVLTRFAQLYCHFSTFRRVYLPVRKDFPGAQGQLYTSSGVHIYGRNSLTWLGWQEREQRQEEKELDKRLEVLKELKEFKPISNLPNDILLNVSDWLPVEKVMSLRLLNSQWNRFFGLVRREIRTEKMHDWKSNIPPGERFANWRGHPGWELVS